MNHFSMAYIMKDCVTALSCRQDTNLVLGFKRRWVRQHMRLVQSRLAKTYGLMGVEIGSYAFCTDSAVKNFLLPPEVAVPEGESQRMAFIVRPSASGFGQRGAFCVARSLSLAFPHVKLG